MSSPASKPFASVVIPTHRRPELLRQCLRSLLDQTFPDFEVIVSDDLGDPATGRVFRETSDRRFRCVRPSGPVPMVENWEFGFGHACGRYRTIVTDKTVLLPSALQVFHDAAARSQAEILSSRIETYDASDPELPSYGRYFPLADAPVRFNPFDPAAELRRKCGFESALAADARNFFLGNVCCGLYREDLVRRMKEAGGGWFFPITADYPAMFSALALARAGVDIPRPLFIGSTTADSIGFQMLRSPAFTRRRLEQLGSDAAYLPIPGLYSSLTCVVAHDYLRMRRCLNLEAEFPVDLANLAESAGEDLAAAQWESPGERRRQHDLLREFQRGLPRRSGARVRKGWSLRSLRSALRRVRAAVRPNRGRDPGVAGIPCASALEAARIAERLRAGASRPEESRAAGRSSVAESPPGVP